MHVTVFMLPDCCNVCLSANPFAHCTLLLLAISSFFKCFGVLLLIIRFLVIFVHSSAMTCVCAFTAWLTEIFATVAFVSEKQIASIYCYRHEQVDTTEIITMNCILSICTSFPTLRETWSLDT